MKKQIPGRASAILPTATAALLALLAATTATHAQTDTTWTRGASNGDWNNASNWSAGVPVAGFNAIFGASVGGDPNQYYTHRDGQDHLRRGLLCRAHATVRGCNGWLERQHRRHLH